MRRPVDWTLVIAGVIGLSALAILVLPIAVLFFSVGWSGLSQAWGEPALMEAIMLSMEAALLATMLSLLVALPLGYFLARTKFPGKQLVEAIIDLPIVVPHVVAGIALLMVFGRHGIIGAPLDEMGLRMTDAMGGIVVAMMFVSSPFLINHAREGFENVDPRLEYVAMGLGASRARALFTVSIPMSKRGIFVGATMCWARAISEFGAVIMIAYFPMIAPTYIYSEYLQYGLDRSAPAAALMLLIIMVIFLALRATFGRWKRYDRD